MNKSKGTKKTYLKSPIVRWACAMALFAALVVYIVAPPLVVHATFTGVNGRISFARFSPSTNSTSIFSVRSNGSGEQQLTFDSPTHASVNSNWSSDGSRIAFDSDRFSNGSTDFMDVFTAKADGTDVVQLTSNVGFNGEPVYSPDGRIIAFESDRGQGAAGEGIYLMNASDGATVRRITAAPIGFFDAFPHFSPSGDRLVFSRVNTCLTRRGPGPQDPGGVAGCLAAVFLVNIDGSGSKQITPWGQDISATDWSPDGTKLVLESSFDIFRGRKVDVLLVNVDGSNLVNFTNNPPISGVPCSISGNAKFSPDSTKLVFAHSDCTGRSTLWIMNSDGSDKQDTEISIMGSETFGSGGVGFPDWGTNQN
jgi:Tol biopolymer transport system component